MMTTNPCRRRIILALCGLTLFLNAQEESESSNAEIYSEESTAPSEPETLTEAPTIALENENDFQQTESTPEPEIGTVQFKTIETQEESRIDTQSPELNEAPYTTVPPARSPEEQKIVIVGPNASSSEEPQQRKKRRHWRRRREPLIEFSFENTDLVKILNEYASKKEITLILPQGANAINQKITFKLATPLTLTETERYIDLFLDLAGYAMRKQGDWYIISKNDSISREPLPLYINVFPDDLPQSQQRIRFVYTFNTLKVPESPQANEPMNAILRDMLSAGAQNYFFDTRSNSVIISDKASIIASAMSILAELDAVGAREVIEIVPLHNHNAATVASILKAQILALMPQPGTKTTRTEAEAYFSPYTRVVADKRTNSLILMGKETTIERLKEFIREYMDAPLDSGRSILHTYDLQYLDAETFARDLQQMVKPASVTGQATKEGSGPEKIFEGVIVKAETYKPVQSAQKVVGGSATGAETAGTVFKGGNRLIVAAKNSDWLQIKELIKKLDEPQPQVIIEVLILDLSFTSNRLIASQLRNPTDGILPPGVEAQSAQAIAPIVNQDGSGNVTSIVPDLLKLLAGGTSAATGMSTGSAAGSMVFSVNDPSGSGIWALLQILRGFIQTRIVSHPFMVIRNNARGEEILSDIRRLQGDASTSEGGVAIAKQVDVRADLKISVVPRISSKERLSLQLAIDIQQFRGSTSERDTRRLETNVNLSSGQILVLGGLTRLEESDGTSETPLLGKIPLIGWLFKKNSKTMIRSNLAVFISPTIVYPRFREGQHEYTGNKVVRAYNDLSEGVIFDNLRDPITRFFFAGDTDKNEAIVDDYLANVKDTGIVNKAIPIKRQKSKRSSAYRKGKLKAKYDEASTNGAKLDEQLIKEKLSGEENPLAPPAAETIISSTAPEAVVAPSGPQ